MRECAQFTVQKYNTTSPYGISGEFVLKKGKMNGKIHWDRAIPGVVISSRAIFSSASAMNNLTKALSLL